MNVIIPMMGIGKRFLDAGYYEDKPFIKADGKLIIQRVIEPLLIVFDSVHIACRKEQAVRLHKVFPEDKVIIHILEESKGASHTIYQVCKEIDNDEQVLCVDCDIILRDICLNVLTDDNAILTFKDEQKSGIYSYLEVNDDKIVRIVEKEAISDIANAGVYLFKNAKLVLDNYKDNDKEQYLSDVVAECIKNGNEFYSIDITNAFDCVGTPHQLQTYCKKKEIYGKIFCFDLDMTLVYDVLTYPKPIQKNVDYCNFLYDNGAKIIIHTARGMKSLNNDVSAIEELLKPKIIDTLKECGIKYHELIIGKPFADFYIDDKAISSFRDLHKETGVYIPIDNEARKHHTINVQPDIIIKKGNLENENYYYSNLPNQILERYFPKVLYASDNLIHLERIDKPTYSSLMMSGKLKKMHISYLLDNLYEIHNYKQVPCSDWAYTTKVWERFIDNITFYDRLGINLSDVLSLYDKPILTSGAIIHGDPVFTNIFSNGKMIDPRGNWDNAPTIYGDKDYDYAKVLQSILGYDYALNDIEIEDAYVQYLYQEFADWYKDRYPHKDIQQLKNLTRILMVSMLPLHKEDINRCKRFIKLINQIV